MRFDIGVFQSLRRHAGLQLGRDVRQVASERGFKITKRDLGIRRYSWSYGLDDDHKPIILAYAQGDGDGAIWKIDGWRKDELL